MWRRGPFGRGIGWSGLEQSGDLDGTYEGTVSLKEIVFRQFLSVPLRPFARVPIDRCESGLRGCRFRLLARKSRLWNQVQRPEQLPVVIDAGISGRKKFVAIKDGIGSCEQAESLGFS